MPKPIRVEQSSGYPRVTTEGPPSNFDIFLLPSIPSLISLEAQIKRADQEQLSNFYYPLMAILYHISHNSLKRINFIKKNLSPQAKEQDIIATLNGTPSSQKENFNPDYIDSFVWDNLQSWFKLFTQFFENVFKELKVEDMSELETDFRSYSLEPFSYNFLTFIHIIHWLSRVTDQKNHFGNPPFYIYINALKELGIPAVLPKILFNGEGVCSFNNRATVVNPGGFTALSREQKAEMWNHLLVHENIYGDGTIDHSVRVKVFEEMIKLFPQGEISHLDLCGGTGAFPKWLEAQALPQTQISSIMIDNADEAVSIAQQRGLNAIVGDAEQPLKIDNPVDVITIIFAVQWLTDNAFDHVMAALKPGGKLIANIYPPTLENTNLYIETLESKGFEFETHGPENLKYLESITETGQKQFVLSAKRPIN